MKKVQILLITFLLIILSPLSYSFAHGGVQNTAGDVTATFFVSPLLPKINEVSTISFNITDKDSGKRLPYYPTVLRIKETEDDNEDHDKILLKENIKTDVNGAIQIEFKFPTNKIYDVELEFPNVKDLENDVGFLVQPEENPSNVLPYSVIVIALLGGVAVGYILKSYKKPIV